MYHNKLIKYLYLGLTLFALITPVKVSFLSFLPGLVLMWLIYLFYYAGIKKKDIDYPPYKAIILENRKCRFTIYVAIAYIIFYPLYIKLYTGLNIVTTLSNAMSGVSNYALYQAYFAESKLYTFSLSKLPYIIIHGILKFLFIIIIFRNVIYRNRRSLVDIFSIGVMVLTIAIVGISRGTSYEFFELFFLFFFAIMTKRALAEHKKLISKNMLVRIAVVTSVILIFFSYNIQKRFGESFNFFSDSHFDKQSILYLISKPVALIFYLLSDYFLFGLQFNSIIISKLWFCSFPGFISMVTPFGITLFQIDTGYKGFVNQFIDVGVKWIPDSISLINSYGIILSLILIYFLGRFSRRIYNDINTNIYASILLFYSCYFMFSLPIGNFITASSANIITIFCAIIFYKSDFLKRLLNQIKLKFNK